MVIGIGTGIPFQKMGNWTPSKISTILWLDATDTSTIILNGSNVSQWLDKSGKDNHATQANQSYQPVYDSSNNQIKFTNHHLNVTSLLDKFKNVNEINAIAVIDYDDVYGSIFFASRGNSSTGARFLIGNNIGVAGYQVAGTRLDSDNYTSIQVSPVPLSTIIQHGQIKYSSSEAYLYKNGEIVAQDTMFLTDGQTDTTDCISVKIGAIAASNAELNGNIKELIVLNEPLSEENRQKTEGYLAHKWNLFANLPAGHPYKNAPPKA